MVGPWAYESEFSYNLFARGNPQGQAAPQKLVVTGVFVKSHDVLLSFLLPFRHTSIRIVPRNQDHWLQQRPNDFVESDPYGRSPYEP